MVSIYEGIQFQTMAVIKTKPRFIYREVIHLNFNNNEGLLPCLRLCLGSISGEKGTYEGEYCDCIHDKEE